MASDEQRDLVLRAGAEPGVVQVAEDVLAGTDLGDHAAGGELDGGGGAGADHLCGDPDTGEAAYRGGERGFLVLRGALASVPAGAAVTRIGEDAHRHQAAVAGGEREVARDLGRRPGTTGAAVDLDHDLQPVRFVSHRVGEGFDRGEVVDADPQPGGLGEPADPRPLRSRGPDRVGEEDVVESGRGEDLGLADIARGDPDRPGLDLAPADLHALVRLDVRPDVEVVLGGEALHAVDVALA